MTTATIRFQAPPDDPYKVPRPVHLIVNDDDPGLFVQRGGEFGNADLIGLVPVLDAPDDFTDPAQWCDVRDLAAQAHAGDVTDLGHSGWYPAVIDETGMYTVGYVIDRIEVTR